MKKSNVEKYSVNKHWVCEDCTFVFTTNTAIRKGLKPFCPNCGEKIYISKYQSDVSQSQPVHMRWSEEELKVLQKYIDGTLMLHQVSIMLGRSRSSVNNKARRMLGKE